jgi:hypothetical protein
MDSLIFVPTIYSRKSTPLDLREYKLEGYPNGPCGCMHECLEFAKEKGYSKVIFKTLENTKIVKVVA